VTPAEAVFLRQTIRDVLKGNNKVKSESMDRIFTYPEIFERFFFHYYGINLSEYYKNIKEKDFEKSRNDLYKYVQEKLRKDRELI
jgi:hypothetical protein